MMKLFIFQNIEFLFLPEFSVLFLLGIKSDWLLKGSVTGISNNKCHHQYEPLKVSGLSNGILHSQICAVGERTSRGIAVDTCPGDSGSALQVSSNHNHKYYLVGLTSFGLGCGSTFPSIYSKISSRVQWIESFVWPNSK